MTREQTIRKATTALMTAIDLPIGAGLYVVWGWPAVILASVWFLLIWLGLIAWGAWKEVRRA